MTDNAPLTWRELWAETTTALDDRNHARWMCEAASGCDGAEFVAELDQPAMHSMVVHLDAMISRRQLGEPLQYVLGHWQFRRLDLMIDKRVLIPRPETEWVCEAALELARGAWNSTRTPLQIADLGTGSGAIGLSLAAEMPLGSAAVWLADVSQGAVDVASANLAGIGPGASSVRIVQGSWFDALPDECRGTLDLIVANPPYIAQDNAVANDYPDVDDEVSRWEPHVALFGGADGLRDIRIIAKEAPEWLRPGGHLVLEIGSDQGARVKTLLGDARLNDVEIRADLAGRDRIAIARR